MTDFEEALKSTLLGMNKAFEAADEDLHQEVVSAAQAIDSITKGSATLELRLGNEDEKGMVYGLYLGRKDAEEMICAFWVGTQGYPILSGPNIRTIYKALKSTASQGGVVELAGKQELSRYMSNMASNPDSVLVKKLAFLLRRKERLEQ